MSIRTEIALLAAAGAGTGVGAALATAEAHTNPVEIRIEQICAGLASIRRRKDEGTRLKWEQDQLRLGIRHLSVDAEHMQKIEEAFARVQEARAKQDNNAFFEAISDFHDFIECFF